MTTLEKLFVQIFERKDRIIEQVQQQADSYTQQLASTLLIDGITPPPWLLNPRFDSCSSDPNELEKEEIISTLLLQPPRDSIPYPNGRTMCYQPGGNGWLSNEMCMETHAPNKGFNLSNGPTMTIDCHNKDIGCNLNHVTEQDDSVSSPQDETDARISSIYAAPDTSLARIQRSRSRQKARELRTNVKMAAKSCLSNENRTRISFSGDLTSKINFHEITQDNCASELDNSNEICRTNLVAAEGEVYCGRITRSRSLSQQTNGISKSSKLGTSASCNPKEGIDALPHSGGDLMHELVASNMLLDALKTSQALNDRLGETRAICSNDGVLKPVISSNIAAFRVTRSRSGSLKESAIGANHQENTKIVVGNGPIDVPDAKQSMSSGTELDLITVCTEAEGLASRQPSLGGHAAKTSKTGKTQDTQRHIKVYCGRVTRSRSSIRQTSGINNYSKPGTSSCNPEEETDALPDSDGDMMHGLDASNKFQYALETSQVLNDRIGETRAICSNGVLKPINSFNIVAPRVSRSGSLKEYTIGANHQENAVTVVGNGPMDAWLAKQSVSPGIKLDRVTLCIESEGLASRQPSDCCLKVKPRQLNFDETGECDLNETCPLAKKSKLDGLSGKESCHSNDSASSINHKSSSTSIEQNLPTANVLSSKSKAARTHFHDNFEFDECAEDETMNIGLVTNDIPLVERVEHNSKVSLHDDVAVPCEGDTGHKGEESAAGVYVPVSKDTKASFVSSLTKQGNNDSKDCLDKERRMPEQDLNSSKSKELEVHMNPKLSNLKLNTAEVNTWPQTQQRNVMCQSNCFSDSRGFGLHNQRDAILCDLKAPESDLHCLQERSSMLSSGEVHVSQPDGIQSREQRVDDGMMCDLSEGIEPLHRLQAAEATVTEVDDGTTETAYALKQSGSTCILNQINNSAEDSTSSLAADEGAANQTSNDDVAVTDDNNFMRSLPEWASPLETDVMSTYNAVRSPPNDEKTVVGSDDIMPVYEGFVIDEEVENERTENAESVIDFDTLEIPSTTIVRASILEQLCKSASMQTPLSELSSAFKQHTIPDLYGFMADGLLEHMNPISAVSYNEDSRKHLRASDSDVTEVDSTFPKLQKFDLLPFSSTPFCWQSKNHYSSPVGKLWERSASSSGSSEMQLSSNPELTCFPIEEDPISNDESENAEEAIDALQIIDSGAVKDLVECELPTEPTEVRVHLPITVSMEMEIPIKENDDEVFEVQEGIVSRAEIDLAEKKSHSVSTQVCLQNVDPLSMSIKYQDRCSSNSKNIELSFPGTHDKVKHKPKNHLGIKVSRFEVENRNSSVSTSSRGNVSHQIEYGKNKSSMRNGIPRVSQKEAKRNNIVSNITSFIPIVQQKQAAAVCTGKRDIKVKALEAAEAAKRREQEKENERKMKKEALKIERARIEKENARELELNKKKKQEEQKKKEADMAERKRLREEDERKQMGKKRKHAADARKEQKLQYEKSRGGKVEAEKQHGKNAILAASKKGSDNTTEIQRRNQNADENNSRRQETTLASVIPQLTSVPENRDASNACGNTEKATNALEKSPAHDGSVRLTSQEKSYDISPYRSDDDDEDDDELPTKKFVPSWASKSRVATVLPLQQKLDPETIFSVESFCSMDEVLLPPRLQA